jgi:hypothetical protein
MDRRPPFTRKIQIGLDQYGRISHWKCSECRWTAPIGERFNRIEPPQSALRSFYEHNCREHQRESAEEKAG